MDDVLGLMAQQQTGEGDTFQEAASFLEGLANDPNATDSLKRLMQAVGAILNGSRDPALADNPALYYDDAAEILFLIERLGG